MKILFIIWILIQTSFQLNPWLYQRPTDCDDSKLFCYGNENDNQIRNYLKSLSESEKAKLMEEQINHYTLVKMQVKKTKNKGLALILQEDIHQNQPIWKLDHYKMVGSIQINFGMFFQNSLSLSHKKCQLKFKQIHERFSFNMLYHFSNILKSFLKGDLSNLPFNDISPIFHLTPYEIELFNTDFTKNIFEYTIANQLSVKKDYKDFISEMRRQLSQQQITLMFQRDHISLHEFILIRQYQKSRNHGKLLKSKNESFLTPIMHYVNCYDELHERISNFENLPSQKYVYFNKLGAFKKGEEYLNYYNYKHVHIYVMWGGFVPKIFSRYCFTVQLIQEKYVKQFKLPENVCLTDDKIYLYINHLNQNVRKYNYEDTDINNYYKTLEILRPGLKDLKFQKDELQTFIQELQEYIDYRNKNSFNTNHFQTVLDYIKFRFNYLQNRPEIILKYVKKYWLN